MCTNYAISKNNVTFAALNFDWFDDKPGEVIIRTPRNGRYGYMLTSKFGRHFPYDGMNERGLYLGQTAVPVIRRPLSLRNPVVSTFILPRILETCTTVKEAVEVLQSRSIIFGTLLGQVMFHVLVADAAGNSAIVEFMDKTRVITKDKDYLLMTNFYVSDPAILWKNHVEGCGGYQRYDRADRVLKDMHTPSFDSCAETCRASLMHGFTYEGKTMNTLWSGIYDLDNLAMRLYVRKDFTSPRDFHLPEELQKGNNSYRME